MSPEQAEGKNIDQRSDIFSFGAVLYEMATGERAFRGDSLISTLAAVLTIEPTPVQTIIPAWPAALDRVLQKCLRKKPEQRYANIAEVRQSLKHLQPERRRTKSIAVAAIGLTAFVLTLAAVSGLRRETRAQLGAPLPRPTQITRDLGLNADPSLSPDEQWIAYVSDREVAGKFGIWLHNLQSGSERQVVGGCDRAADPVFTPDGTKLIYVCQLSGEETATMYEVAIAGGSPKRMVAGASWPSPSPDGKSVAYILNSQDLYISRLSDGAAVRLTSNVRPIYRAVWSPDGKHLMFYGAPSSDLSALNFWVIPTDRQGVAPAKSSLSDVLSMKIRIGPEPQLPILLGWKQSGVYVSRPLGETRDVWRVAVDSNGLHAVGTQVPVTMNVDPRNGSVANQRIVFDRRNQRSNLMSLSLDQQTSRASGPPRPLTSDEASNYYATAPGHGRTIVYTSTRRGTSELFSLDVTTGQRTKLPVPATQYSARITSDGSRIAWTSDGKHGVYVSAWPSVNPVPLCTACGVVLDWLPDKSAVLLSRDPDHEHSLVHLDLNTRTRKAIVTESDRLITSASVSPDGRWVAFRSELGNRARVYIAPLSGSNLIPRSQWILIVDDSSPGSYSWSADGGLLYFAAWGAREMVAIPLHSKTKYPLGPAVSVTSRRPKVSY